MSDVLVRIEQTRQLLLDALATRNWDAVGELDLECRLRISDLLADAQGNVVEVRDSLEQLLDVYRQLIEAASGERQTIVDEMTQIRQAKNAAKVYHLFS
ncbi:flagellar protein FliT [Pseudomonas sp. PSKL.D1]|uniref:flagellar protein FliT n=1 Tax=Pseudomonas sp. PSKL.D1 TaxID=3029060 RepID=UPI002380D5AE|nr:flagellar protein FliT [Pseudomonas sp. PSKL.D1]WDY59474.1 flagellar protein FliT [Pseudomonas sp. PSKL.D1]